MKPLFIWPQVTSQDDPKVRSEDLGGAFYPPLPLTKEIILVIHHFFAINNLIFKVLHSESLTETCKSLDLLSFFFTLKHILFNNKLPLRIMRLFSKALILIILSLSVSGCNTLLDAANSKGSGKYRIYNKSYDTVWNTTIKTVNASSLDLIVANKEEGKILAEGAISGFSWGEKVAIFIERIGNKIKTRVEVISKRALATNFTAKNWENHILKDLDKKLAN